jgi:hypothetical protein
MATQCGNECLNETLFISLTHGRKVLAIWKDGYNKVKTAQISRRSRGRCINRACIPGPTWDYSHRGKKEATHVKRDFAIGRLKVGIRRSINIDQFDFG